MTTIINLCGFVNDPSVSVGLGTNYPWGFSYSDLLSVYAKLAYGGTATINYSAIATNSLGGLDIENSAEGIVALSSDACNISNISFSASESDSYIPEDLSTLPGYPWGLDLVYSSEISAGAFVSWSAYFTFLLSGVFQSSSGLYYPYVSLTISAASQVSASGVFSGEDGCTSYTGSDSFKQKVITTTTSNGDFSSGTISFLGVTVPVRIYTNNATDQKYSDNSECGIIENIGTLGADLDASATISSIVWSAPILPP